MRRALQVILSVSLFGVAVSGALSYQGFFMYLFVAVTAALGLFFARRGQQASPHRQPVTQPGGAV